MTLFVDHKVALRNLILDIIHTVVLMHYIPFIVSVKTWQLLYDLFIK